MFVGSKKIPNLNADNKYAPAFKNGEFRKDLRKKYSSLALDGKSPENDPIEKTIYFCFPFTKIKNLKDEERQQLEEWSVAFCKLLDIVKPMEIIIDGEKIRNFLVNEIFEDTAKKIWKMDVGDSFEGKILRIHLRFIEPNCQFEGLPLHRPFSEIKELGDIIDNMGHAIANVHDIFYFVINEVNDEAKAYFEGEYFDGETLADKLKAQYSLLFQWEKLKEIKYRLTENKEISKTDKLILNASIIDDIIDFFDFKKRDNLIDENTMPCAKVNAIIECVKRLRILDYETKKGELKSVCDNAILFYILLEWALNGKSPDEIILKLGIKVNYESCKPKDDMIIGNNGNTVLSHVYEYFVTNKTIRNARNANQMKELFTKDKKTLWKPKKILDEVPYTHVSWHPYIDKSWKKN